MKLQQAIDLVHHVVSGRYNNVSSYKVINKPKESEIKNLINSFTLGKVSIIVYSIDGVEYTRAANVEGFNKLIKF